MKKVLLIDNFDSFTYNLEHYLLIQKIEVDTFRCDKIPLNIDIKSCYNGVVISPGPGRPEEAGLLMEALNQFSNDPSLPVLGICLGMQAMGLYHNFEVMRAPIPVHGKTSTIVHDQKGIFSNIPTPLSVMRYHSLILHHIDLDLVEISATSIADQLPMAIRFHHLPWEGVQFHPESILTQYGLEMIKNWVNSID
jgi:anthranilate synthase/aminodeoxychorismate synthase-like glutamine amidotransferase